MFDLPRIYRELSLKPIVNGADADDFLSDSSAARSSMESSDAHIRSRALQWVVIFSSGEITNAETAEFEKWLSSDARHATAWAHVNRLFKSVDSIDARAASTVLRSNTISSSRRNMLLGLGVMAGAGMLSYSVGRSSQWGALTADFRTATGEQRVGMLADGTKIIINTASAIDVKYSANERRIVVLRGEVLVITAPDNASMSRPFIVETAAGDIRAIGTRFSVRRFENTNPNDILVHVFEGAVEVGARNSEAKVLVKAGQKIQFNRDGAGQPVETESIASAWAEGKLIAERMRLEDFLAELGRYRSGFIRCDKEVANIVISGVYPLHNTDAILQSLVQALPVRVSMTTKYWVSVSAL